MKTHANKVQKSSGRSFVNNASSKQNGSNSTFQFVDNRTETAVQMKLRNIANGHSGIPVQKQVLEDEELMQGKFETIQKVEEEELLQGKFEPVQKAGEEEELLQGKFQTVQKVEEEEEPLQGKFETVQKVEEEELLQGKFETVQKVEEEELLQGKFEPVQKVEEEEELQAKFEPIQKVENNTGLPDNLKSGVENLSGQSLDDVKVHYNSDKPSQLQAHAYAQGTDIHVAPGQEKHLPHEAWHVVQQKQGRVKPTMQMKGNVNVNDDVGLEKEADVMGAKALQLKEKLPTKIPQNLNQKIPNKSSAVNPTYQRYSKTNYQSTNKQHPVQNKEILQRAIQFMAADPDFKKKHTAVSEEEAITISKNRTGKWQYNSLMDWSIELYKSAFAFDETKSGPFNVVSGGWLVTKPNKGKGLRTAKLAKVEGDFTGTASKGTDENGKVVGIANHSDGWKNESKKGEKDIT